MFMNVGWVRVTSVAITVVVSIAAISGAMMEQVARRRVRDHVQVPGILVDIGNGRRMQMDCRGTGTPTIVLESGLDAYGSLAWASVHDSLAAHTRTCAYSRAGIMWSDRNRGAFDSRNAAHDLHRALAAAGESGPLVMVGHSVGAAYVMTFTHQYPSAVRGIVLVDGSHPDQFAQFRDVTGKSLVPSAIAARVGAALSWTGLVRALPHTSSPASWPSVVDSIAPAFLPISLHALAGEVRAVTSSLAVAGTTRSLGDRPLVVLTAMRPHTPAERAAMAVTVAESERMQTVWRTLHEDQASWSSAGRHEVVHDASHYIQFDRPDVVIAAVLDVVTAVRFRQSDGFHAAMPARR